VRHGVWRSRDLSRRGRVNQHWSDRLEVERGLNAGFGTSRDENSFKAAVAELDGVGIECVLACIE
jgi:hypothetical protein